MKTDLDYQKIFDSITKINDIFGLAEQGKSLVSLVSRHLKSPGVCLLFLSSTGEKYSVLSCKPAPRSHKLSWISIDAASAPLKLLLENKEVITSESPLAGDIKKCIELDSHSSNELETISLIVPLISAGKLIGILFVERKDSKEYTAEEIQLVEGILTRVATAMEKEYLRDQLGKREKDLMVLNSCSRIISSNLETSNVFSEFIRQLEPVVDVEWAAILLIEGDTMSVIAIYSDIGTTWEPGEVMPVKGTSTEWVTASMMPLVESDLRNDSLFVTDVYHRKQGLRSVCCLPLIKDRQEAIGSLIIGSRKPNVYNAKQVEFLAMLASQITMPVWNAGVYAEVLKRSRYDELTGLLNRRTMDEQIINEINRHSRYGGVFSLILLDLDSMKYINDHFGHLAGDGLLARTGSVLTDAIRSVDQAFRYGGDEFAILLPNTTAASAVKVSERIRTRIASRLVVDEMTVTASFGLASWPDDGPEAVDIVGAADNALYKAKNEGGNRSFSSNQK